MAYSKITWVNDSSPAINANNLNRMEEGIDESQKGRIQLDTSASPGTDDGDLYEALVALGWDSEVIEA